MQERGAGNESKIAVPPHFCRLAELKEMGRHQPKAGRRTKMGKGHLRGTASISLATRIRI